LTHNRWVVNKIRALATYFTKGVEGGAQLRSAINSADSLDSLRRTIETHYSVGLGV
jgi:hypothetical protein